MKEPNERGLAISPPQRGTVVTARRGDNLADILERVLDKGIVIAGDITVSLATVELLSIKIRLLIASVDKAKEMGINWWEHDPALTASATARREEDVLVHERLDRLEQKLEAALPAPKKRSRPVRRPRSRVRPRRFERERQRGSAAPPPSPARARKGE